MTEKYYFTMRKDIPPGFIENGRIPELPAAYKFLQMYCGLRYNTKQEFERDMQKFPEYLKKNDISQGIDPEVRRGIFFFEGDTVGVWNDGLSERCEFGRLEKEVLK